MNFVIMFVIFANIKIVIYSYKYMQKQPCIECNNKAPKFTKINEYVCMVCRKLDKYNVISKTNAKKIYFLKDNDLTNIKAYKANSSYGPATYYIKQDLIDYCCIKYNTNKSNIDSILEYMINKKKRLTDIKQLAKKQKKKEHMQILKYKLVNELHKVGVNFRDDSILCQKYIQGSKEHSLKFIIKRMCQMKYLFDYCKMDKCKDEVYKNHKNKYGCYYPGKIFEYAEIMALEKYSNGKYPDVYPWQ